jgi:hypothetical protein
MKVERVNAMAISSVGVGCKRQKSPKLLPVAGLAASKEMSLSIINSAKMADF